MRRGRSGAVQGPITSWGFVWISIIVLIGISLRLRLHQVGAMADIHNASAHAEIIYRT